MRKVAEAQPVLRIALDNGRALRVGPEQILLKEDMRETRAADLRAGDELLNAFAFPPGYEYKTDDGQTRQGRITYVASKAEFTPKNVQTRDEPGGEADLYSLKVVRTGRFVFSSGVIGKAAP